MSLEGSSSPLPSVDRIIRAPELVSDIDRYGRRAVIDVIRAVLDGYRANGKPEANRTFDFDAIVRVVAITLQERSRPSLRRVFNMTGTVLHTNLGRTILSERAVAHASMAMREPCNLEFDLRDGERGDRDDLVANLITELTGAEAATVVNNNAAAVLLTLASLAARREVVLSRGEMIEIGGAFRIPDVMRGANARLVEVGTTNRTHASDYVGAINPATAALMKVHTSNFKVVGFVADVEEAELAAIAHSHDLPLIVDLGAGSLIDLSVYGLPKEPVVRETLLSGADVVTFSADKLLGGPQAGLIVGKKSLISKIKRHPLKRALRVSKLTLAALEATLLAYRTPDFLTRDLPTLRILTRPLADIEALAARLCPVLAEALGTKWQVTSIPVKSQVGSGSLPVDVIPSVALAISSITPKSGSALKALAKKLRGLPVPIIGRITDNQLLLDLRCLEDEQEFVSQMDCLRTS